MNSQYLLFRHNRVGLQTNTNLDFPNCQAIYWNSVIMHCGTPSVDPDIGYFFACRSTWYLMFMCQTQVHLMYGLITAITTTVTIVCVTIQRRHLMVICALIPANNSRWFFVLLLCGCFRRFVLTLVIFQLCRCGVCLHRNMYLMRLGFS